MLFLEGGRYYAIDDHCPHQGAPLCDGMVSEGTVTCTWHGWRFGLEDGRWLEALGFASGRTRAGRGEEIQVAVD